MGLQIRDLVATWKDEDAKRVAKFLHVASSGWPGGAQDMESPEETARNIRESKLLGIFVAELDGKMVAFCKLGTLPAEKGGAYVPYLTADPAYHGRGFGKAVLLAAIERAYELGYERVDLYTWPGNEKAIPLYKKSGFMWAPDDGWGVHMQNFTPGARRHAMAQDYFAKHDWYATFKRELTLAPDEQLRGKAKVYNYEWEADGERLRLVYDRKSWGLLEIENNELTVGCVLEDEKLIAGIPQRLRWRIANRKGRPIQVVLMAAGDPGIKLEHHQTLTVTDTAEIEATFEIDPEIKPKDEEPRSAIIRTDMLIDGMPLQLAAGFEVKPAIWFNWDGWQSLRPGQPEPVTITCNSELDLPAELQARLVAAGGLELDITDAQVKLPAHGTAEIHATACGKPGALGPVKVIAQAQTKERSIPIKVSEMYLHALAPGEVAGRVEKDCVVLESMTLRLWVGRRGGYCWLTDKIRNRIDVAGIGAPQTGPPFGRDEFFQTTCEARIEQEPGAATVVLTTPSTFQPGVVLERRLRLSNLPIIEITDTIQNGSAVRLAVSRRCGARLNGYDGKQVIQTLQGLIQAPMNEAGRSVSEFRLAETPEAWPEQWVAAEQRDSWALGMLWSQAQRIEFWGGYCQLQWELPALEAGQSHTTAPVYLFVGEGNAQTVRRWWQMLNGPRQIRNQQPLKGREALTFGFAQKPVVLHGTERKIEIEVSAIGRLALEGELQSQMSKAIQIAPMQSKFALTEKKRIQRIAAQLQQCRPLRDGAYPVDWQLQIDRAIYHERQSVIVLGHPQAEVTVAQAGKKHELFVVNNGVFEMTVAPEFIGSVISLLRGKEQLLRSAYPEARPIAWFNPWFGGIAPDIGRLAPRDLAKEKFTAQEITRTGRQGITWRGVRVTCLPKHERARHSGLSLDYLLAPGSQILAIVMRTTRRTGSVGNVGGNFELWPALEDSFSETILSGQTDARGKRLVCEFSGGIGGEGWVLAENPKTQAAIVVAAHAKDNGVYAQVMGKEGYFLAGGHGDLHEARETHERVFFVAWTRREGAKELAEALAQLRELP
jgi:GNAT superfamily N-acetyltransferase